MLLLLRAWRPPVVAPERRRRHCHGSSRRFRKVCVLFCLSLFSVALLGLSHCYRACVLLQPRNNFLLDLFDSVQAFVPLVLA